MTGRGSVWVAVGALFAGAAWVGFGAANADEERQSAAEQRATYRHAITEGTVHSVREAKQLAAEAGLTGRTLVITAHDAKVTIVDVPPRGGDGPSPGDMYITQGPLYDAYHTERIGSQARRCMIEITTFSCDRVFSLAGKGKIHTTGTNAFTGSLEFEPGSAVTGGTGNFRRVRGDAIAFPGQPHRNKDALIILKLVR